MFDNIVDTVYRVSCFQGDRAGKIGAYYPLGLQSFTPQESYYDVIWNQWVLSHLTDGGLKWC